jgi:predicted dehydrogenase
MSYHLNSNLSRRRFLAGTAAAAAALAIRPVFGQQQADTSKKLGFALVGIGSLTMHQILPGFANARLCRPVALVSGHPDKARQQADIYGIDPKNIYNYENFDSVKDNPDIDVVYIVLPNGMHAEYTIRAAQAGKHVLCEKPMANTVEECQSMIDACTAAKRKLLIAYRMHYEPMTQQAIALAQSPDEVGTIKQITAQCGFNMGDPTQWRCNKKLAGGGSLRDIGIYALNAVRYLTGQEPAEVSAFQYSTPDDPRFKEVEETISFELRFDSGIVASVLSTYGFNCNRFQLYGTRGQLESSPFQSYTNNHLYLRRGYDRQEVPYTPVDHFAAEMDALCTNIAQDTTPLTPGEEGLKDMKIMMAAYESAATGKAVPIVL